MDIEKSLESTSKEIEYFEHMVAGSEKLIRPWKSAVIALIIAWVLTIAGFIFFLLQFNFESSNEANGIYAMIDSDGNIVAQDITPEEWDAFTKWWEINGSSQKD